MATTQPDSTSLKKATRKSYRKDQFWQVVFPVIVASVLMLLVVVWLILSAKTGATSLNQYSSIVSIMLIIPSLLALLIGLAILVGLIYLIAKLMNALPDFTDKVRVTLDQVNVETKKLTKGMALPIIKTGELTTKGLQIFTSLRKRLH